MTNIDHAIARGESLFDDDCAVLQRALSKYSNVWLYPTVKNYREDTSANVLAAARQLIANADASPWGPPRIDEMADAPVSLVSVRGRVCPPEGGGVITVSLNRDVQRYLPLGQRVEVRVVP